MTKARDIADFKFEDIVDTGTEGTKVASGTTAQRGSTTGQFRFNSTSGKFEGYDGSSFKVLENSATITSISPTNFESSALPTNIVITGENFSTGDTVKFIGNDNSEITSPSITIDSSTQITAQVPNTVTSEKEPHGVRVTSSSGLSANLGAAFNIDASPVFGVASGSLGSLSDADRASSNLTAVTATDDEGDTITFSQTAGSLPAGITFNSDGTFSGTADAVSSDTTSSFTITASDGTNTTTRDYTITVQQPVASGGTISTYTDNGILYAVHVFNSNSTFTLNTAKTVDYLIVGGGGGGGNYTSNTGGDGGGGGGAGGYYYNTGVSMSAGSYSAVIGSGGSSNSNGGTSSFNGATSGGGGNGGSDHSGGGSGSNGTVGGSGGGTGCRSDSPGSAGSGGNTNERNNGGGVYANDAGAGGGGAGSVGGNTRAGNLGGHGGSGQSNSITGTAVIYAVGGGGGVQSGTGGGDGSANGDGVGAKGSTQATAGTANRGNGGGGSGNSSAGSGASGGSGVVIIRYAA